MTGTSGRLAEHSQNPEVCAGIEDIGRNERQTGSEMVMIEQQPAEIRTSDQGRNRT